jgi:hypothetical protein
LFFAAVFLATDTSARIYVRAFTETVCNCEGWEFAKPSGVGALKDTASGKIAPANCRTASGEGYPSAMSKKKRGCVATYRHSDSGLFEN